MKYIPADILRAKITDLCVNANFYQQKAMEESNREDFVSSGGEIFAYAKVLFLLDSLQQEQPDLPGIEESGIPGKDYIPVEWVDACEMYGKWKIVNQEQPEADLEKAARYVYESWMGGTMDDVRRDMVELGRVINARKEESK